jgi:hypothetical protein
MTGRLHRFNFQGLVAGKNRIHDDARVVRQLEAQCGARLVA